MGSGERGAFAPVASPPETSPPDPRSVQATLGIRLPTLPSPPSAFPRGARSPAPFRGPGGVATRIGHLMTSFRDRLLAAERRNRSLLCVGLDPDPARFPGSWRDDPSAIGDFCAAIVDATRDLVLAYKPQIAHFAAHRAEAQLERLIEHVRRAAPGVPVVLDAKRGDIGSTAEFYAREAFERYDADAVTVSPYLGFDSIEPYLAFADRGIFVLCRTSNPGGADLQHQPLAAPGEPRLFEHLARLVAEHWNTGGQLGMVVGATYPGELARVRELAPQLPLLLPGFGAQGGDAEAAIAAGYRGRGGPVLVSSSRAILYAGGGADFQDAARKAASDARDQLEKAAGAATEWRTVPS